MTTDATENPFPKLLRSFFCEHLIAERSVSPRTVASYRDAFRLLLNFVLEARGTTASDVTLETLDAPLILDFLDHLEKARQCTARSRNARLAAIRSFMKYVSWREPTCLPTVQRVLAVPNKRCDRRLLGFLSRDEVDAILSAPDGSTWSGLRDRVMFATLYNTGARVSEIIGIRVEDVELEPSARLRLHGKGRKARVIPLWKSTSAKLKRWLARINQRQDDPLFPNRDGGFLSRSGVEKRLRAAVKKASEGCATLKGRKVSPHTFRHSTAMHLLQSGIDITVIALWLGHERPATTNLYVEADLSMKERALASLEDPGGKIGRFRADDELLSFLRAL